MPLPIPNAVRREPCVSVKAESARDIAKAVIDAQKEGYHKILGDSDGIHMFQVLPAGDYPPDVTLVTEATELNKYIEIIKGHLKVDIASEVDGILNPKK